jgi:hypothetical protein
VIRKHGLLFSDVDAATDSIPSLDTSKADANGSAGQERAIGRNPVSEVRRLSEVALSPSLNREWGSEEWGTFIRSCRRDRGVPPSGVRRRGLAVM